MATWIKVDDTMVEHPKCADLTPFAWTLWLHGISYCSRNLTDGHIPQAMLPRLSAIKAPEKAAAELVDAGLWHATETGWQVHDYLDHQRSRAEVHADRDASAERQRRSRARRRTQQPEQQHPTVTPPVTPPSRRDRSVSHGTVTPPETETEPESESDHLHQPTCSTGAPPTSGANDPPGPDRGSELWARALAANPAIGTTVDPVALRRELLAAHAEHPDWPDDELVAHVAARCAA